MRLIDADALKKDLTRFYDNEVTARKLIDEQPTIEASPCDFCQYDGCGNPCIVCPATAKEDKDGKDK